MIFLEESSTFTGRRVNVVEWPGVVRMHIYSVPPLPGAAGETLSIKKFRLSRLKETSRYTWWQFIKKKKNIYQNGPAQSTAGPLYLLLCVGEQVN